MIDLSINFPLSEKVRQNILKVEDELRKINSKQRFVPRLKLHCTVKSCGLLGKQISEDVIPEIIDRTEKLLKGVKPFEVQLRGIGNFPGAIFINVIPNSKLLELHNLLNDNIPYSEYPEFEGKGYKPHATMVESVDSSSKLLEVLGKYKNYDFGETKVEIIDIILGGDASPGDKFKVLKSFKL